MRNLVREIERAFETHTPGELAERGLQSLVYAVGCDSEGVRVWVAVAAPGGSRTAWHAVAPGGLAEVVPSALVTALLNWLEDDLKNRPANLVKES